jgi:hypothetical protein
MSIRVNVNPQQGALASVKTQNRVLASTFTVGSSGTLSGLSDVTITAPLLDSSFLIYNSAASRWQNHVLFGGITVSDTGEVTVNYPQPIGPTASPTFVGLTINGPASISGALNVNGAFNLSPAASSGSVSLGSKSFYVNTGGNVTWTLPSIASSLGATYFVKNRGTGTITLNASGSDNLFFTGVQTSVAISPGEAYIVACDGSYWEVM